MGYDLNTCTLIGRLTRDIEIRKTPSGMAVGKFAIANNTTGDKEKVSFFDCYLFGDFAENMAQYLTKGKQVAITGRLNQDRWQTQEGQNRSRIKIIIDRLQLIGGDLQSDQKGDQYNNKQQEKQHDNEPQPSSPDKEKPVAQTYKEKYTSDPEEPDFDSVDIDEDDNIPF